MTAKNTIKSKIKPILLNPIGMAKVNEEKMNYSITIKKKYRPALKELDQYSHVIVIFWADRHDNDEARSALVAEELPFFYGDRAPPMGVFATRSEFRPNPVLISPAQILSIDHSKGILKLAYLDTLDNTPIIDLKPYIPMSDRVMSATYPPYLQHWPDTNEKAAEWWQKLMANAPEGAFE